MSEHPFDLSGRVALVTGGSRGLGRRMAAALGRAGADLAICSRNEAQLQTAAEELRAETGRRVFGRVADVTDEAEVQALVAGAVAELGKLDILVNNAGVGLRKPLLELSRAEWSRILDICLTGPFLVARAAVPGMIERGWGRVINISSALGAVGLPDRGPYCAAKGGLLMLTKVMTLEWARQGIVINAICPGPFKTPYNLQLTENADLYESYLNLIPQHRWGELKEIEGACLFLASEAASYVNGGALYVDGGWTAHGGTPLAGARDSEGYHADPRTRTDRARIGLDGDA